MKETDRVNVDHMKKTRGAPEGHHSRIWGSSKGSARGPIHPVSSNAKVGTGGSEFKGFKSERAMVAWY